MLLIKWHSLASEQQTDKRELKGVRDGERERERENICHISKEPKDQNDKTAVKIKIPVRV